MDYQLPDVSLYIVGTGLTLPSHLTLEAFTAITHVRQLYGLPLPGMDLALTCDLIDLTREYSVGRRDHAYRAMVEAVMTGATNAAPVAFVTYGSPVVGTSVTRMLVEEAANKSISYHICDAVSSLTTVLGICNYDPFNGLQIWDATTFLMNKVVPNTATALLLFQAPHVGVTIWSPTADASNSRAIDDLSSQLIAAYSEDHPVQIVEVPATNLHLSGQENSIKHQIEMAELASFLRRPSNATIFIPACAR